MTAFTDFLDLRAAVVEQVGSEKIVDVFPRLVNLAEIALNRKLRCREQITSTTLTFSSGSASLPSDYAEAIGLFDSSGYEYVQQPLQNVKVSSLSDTYYTVLASTIYMTASDGDRTFNYYAEVPTITDSMDDSNWLLQKHPAVYLYAVSYEAAKWLRDLEMVQQIKVLMDWEIESANEQDYSDRYSAARVRVGGVTP